MTTRKLECAATLTVSGDADPVITLGGLQFTITPSQAVQLLIGEGVELADDAVRQNTQGLSVLSDRGRSVAIEPAKKVSVGDQLRARYAERLARGVCSFCEKPVVTGSRYCRAHRSRMAKRGHQ